MKLPDFDGSIEYWSIKLLLAMATNGVDWTKELNTFLFYLLMR